MATVTESEAPAELSPRLRHRLAVLRQTDNVTSWFYLAREYLVLGVVLGLPLFFWEHREGWGLAWAWNIPVAALAVILVGGLQHRLAALGHEAVHYTLFRNRLLNELASDWLCMFPLLSSTAYYRPQHLGHHQHVNDPERDPDLAQMAASGHRFPFPMSRVRFVWTCVLRQLLWPPRLVGYILVRARYASVGDAAGPYELPEPRSRLLPAFEVLYLLALAAMLTALVWSGGPAWVLLAIPATFLASALILTGLLPERYYRRTALRPVVPLRWTAFARMGYFTVLFTGLAWLSRTTGAPWGAYYVVLWLVPLGTSFAFFMILRQVVQHENADRGRLTNTRVFRVGGLLGWAVFPYGMDYHLPHHLYPAVPHYRLPQLHALLLEDERYRRQAVVAEGYFLPHRPPPAPPTVLDLMAARPPG